MTIVAGSQVFRFEALRADGRREHGTLAAPDAARASRILRDRGLMPVAVRASAGRFASGVSQRDLAAGLFTLAELIGAGMPVNRAVRIFANVAPGGWKKVLPHVEEALRSGASLSGALAVVPNAVPAGVLAVIAAGEYGDGIAPGLRRAAELVENAAAARTALMSALAYPALLATAGTGSVFLLVGVVIPRFASVIAELGQSLPPMSRVLLSAGDIVASAWPVAMLAGIAVVCAWWTWVRTPAGALTWHELLLGIPMLGSIRRSSGVTRACASASAMLASGVPMPDALRLAADATGDLALKRRLLAARGQIIAGAAVSDACTSSDAMTPTAVQLIRVGEESGQLATMLARAARIHGDEALSRTRMVVRLVEPALILVFAGIIASIAAALFQAMYSVRAVA